LVGPGTRFCPAADFPYAVEVSTGPLDGKVILVVGGTSGIGRAGVTACLEAGARVVAVGRRASGTRQLEGRWPGRVLIRCADARRPATVDDAIRLAEQQFGGIHGLFHVAGGSGRRWGDGPLHEVPDPAWRRTLDLNLTSAFFSNRAALRYFLGKRQPGSILNLTSVLAWSPAPEGFGTHAYAAAKSAIVGMTKSVAAYYAPHGIRINALAPGLTDTPMASRALGDPDLMSRVRARQPLDGGRAVQTADLEAAIVYFLSDQSGFVTGQVLAVDGGWTAHC
jgi:NAD(P)-dependent dehydrogenase (short-subunit alcohol dehydrogenase family)